MDLKKISIIVGLILTAASIVGAGYKWHELNAYKCDVELVSFRLEQKILADQAFQIQQRIWALEDRFGGPGVPFADQRIKDEYRYLQMELENVKMKLKGGK